MRAGACRRLHFHFLCRVAPLAPSVDHDVATPPPPSSSLTIVVGALQIELSNIKVTLSPNVNYVFLGSPNVVFMRQFKCLFNAVMHHLV